VTVSSGPARVEESRPKLGDQFFVLYGDSYLRCSLTDVERAFWIAGKPALMTVLKNDGRWDRSNVDLGKGDV